MCFYVIRREHSFYVLQRRCVITLLLSPLLLFCLLSSGCPYKTLGSVLLMCSHFSRPVLSYKYNYLWFQVLLPIHFSHTGCCNVHVSATKYWPLLCCPVFSSPQIHAFQLSTVVCQLTSTAGRSGCRGKPGNWHCEGGKIQLSQHQSVCITLPFTRLQNYRS